MEQPTLSRDSHAVLLLASHLGSGPDESDSGLGPAGWADFLANVRESDLESPGELLNRDPEEWPANLWTSEATQEWISNRLSRSSNMAMRLEDLNSRGIWVTTIYEETYPEKLGETLGRKAPPFFYVAGTAENLHTEGIGFVGSRDADDDDKDYTKTLVEKTIEDGYSVVSGGARGIDETSEITGIEHGGPVIEFPTEGLQRCLEDTSIQNAVRDETLTLVSHYHPEASWSMGAAMGRNKFIHGFSTYTVVVRSGNESGGTWAGATENLDHDWSSLLVCHHDETPPGNQALIDRGGIPIDPTDVPREESFAGWIESVTSSSSDSTQGDTTHNTDSRQSSLDQF